jgi:hypothetical protein
MPIYNNQDEGINTVNAVAPPHTAQDIGTEIFTDEDNIHNVECDKKLNEMWLVQNGKHVNLVPNQDPWYLNKNYTAVPIIDNLSHQESKSSGVPTPGTVVDISTGNIEENSKETDVLNPNLKKIRSSSGINKYIPYSLLYLLIFFAVLLLIYKLGASRT